MMKQFTRALIARLIAACFVLYLLLDIVKAYLQGGPEAPSGTMLAVSIVLLGGGAVLMVLLSLSTWRREQRAQEEQSQAAPEDAAEDTED